jgi:predicted nucleic acid-binding protein
MTSKFISKSIYLDTNVIMDFLLGRDSSAYDLLQKSISCKYVIIISDVVCAELNYQNLTKEKDMFIRLLESVRKIKVIKTSENDKLEAKNIIKTHRTHYNDALHKVIAVRSSVDYFVTRNVRDFICFKDIIIKLPDEL